MSIASTFARTRRKYVKNSGRYLPAWDEQYRRLKEAEQSETSRTAA